MGTVFKASRQPTKALARRWVQEIESRIARSQVGTDHDDEAPAFKVSFDAFLEGLSNRNATDDRSRGRRRSCIRPLSIATLLLGMGCGASAQRPAPASSVFNATPT